MPPRRKTRKRPPKEKVVRQKVNRRKLAQDIEATLRLNDLIEQIEIMVPEMTARIAALEHLLLEKGLCTREDLVRSREFVRVQED